MQLCYCLQDSFSLLVMDLVKITIIATISVDNQTLRYFLRMLIVFENL